MACFPNGIPAGQPPLNHSAGIATLGAPPYAGGDFLAAKFKGCISNSG